MSGHREYIPIEDENNNESKHQPNQNSMRTSYTGRTMDSYYTTKENNSANGIIFDHKLSDDDDTPLQESTRLLPQSFNGEKLDIDEISPRLSNNDDHLDYITGQASALQPTRKSVDYDPDEMLDRFADDLYQNRDTSDFTLWEKIKDWYRPVYDYSSPLLSDKKIRVPYFGPKHIFRKPIWILIHVFILILILLAIFIPIFFAIIIPHIVQKLVDEVKIGNLDLFEINIGNYSENSLNTAIDVILPTVSLLPITIMLGKADVQIRSRVVDNRPILAVELEPMTFSINHPTRLTLNTSLRMDQTDTVAAATLMKQFSMGGLHDEEFTATGHFPVYLGPIRLYAGLPVSIKIAQMDELQANIPYLLEKIPSFLKTLNLNSRIKQKFTDKELLKTVNDLPYIRMESVEAAPTDSGLAASVIATFENPFRVVMETIYGISLNIQIDKHTMMNVYVNSFQLDPLLQQIKLDVELSFDNVESLAFKNGVYALINGVLDSNSSDVDLGISGPLKILSMPWINPIAKDLRLTMPVSYLTSSLNITSVYEKITNANTIANIISNSNVAIGSYNDILSSILSAEIPYLLPLPSYFTFKGKTALSVIAYNVAVMKINAGPISLKSYKNKDLALLSRFNASTEISFSDLPEASRALARAVNPIFAYEPSSSSISIGQITFKTLKDEEYDWSERLFHDLLIDIPLPALCKECILNEFSKNNNVLIIIEALKNKLPTFIDGNVHLYKETSSSLNADIDSSFTGLDMIHNVLDISSASVSLAIDDMDTLIAGLNKGLYANKETGEVKIGGAFEFLPLVDQHSTVGILVNYIIGYIYSHKMIHPDIDRVSLRNIDFSINEPNDIFRKVKIEFSPLLLAKFADLLYSSIGDDVVEYLLKIPRGPKLSIDESNVKVQGNTVFVNSELKYNNKLKVTMDLEEISLKIKMKDVLCKVYINPIDLVSGEGVLHSKLRIVFPNSKLRLKKSIASFVSALLNNKSLKRYIFYVSEVKFLSSDPEKASIHQLHGLDLPFNGDFLYKAAGFVYEHKLIDISRLIPTKNQLKDMIVNVEKLSLETKMGSVLQMGAVADIFNMIPLGLNLKNLFCGIKVRNSRISPNNVKLLDSQVSNMSIKPNSNFTFDPNVRVQFYDVKGLSEHLQEIINDITKRKNLEDVSILLDEISFGSYDTPIKFFSLVKLDLVQIGKYLYKTFDLKQIFNEFELSISQVIKFLETHINTNIDFAFAENQTLNIDTSLMMKSGIAVEGSVGMIQASTHLDELQFVTALFKKIDFSEVTNMPLSLHFASDDEVKRLIANIADKFVNENLIDNVIGINSIKFGHSETDYIKVLEKLDISLSISDILSLYQTDIYSLIANLDPSYGNILIRSIPGNRVYFDGGVFLDTPFNVNGNIDYTSFSVNIAGNPFINGELPPISCSTESNKITINVRNEIAFVDNKETRLEINSIANNLINGNLLTSFVGISGVNFGLSADDSISLFSLVNLNLDLDKLISAFGIETPFNPIKFIEKASADSSFNVDNIHFEPKIMDTIEIGADVTFHSPLGIDLELNYMSVDITVSELQFAQTVFRKGLMINYDSITKDELIKAEFESRMKDTPQSRSVINNLVNRLFNGKKLDTSAGIKNIAIGNTHHRSDIWTFLSEVNVNIELDSIANSANIASLIDALSKDILDYTINNHFGSLYLAITAPEMLSLISKVDNDTSATRNLDINIGYLSANVWINSSQFTEFTMPHGFQLNSYDKEILRFNVDSKIGFNPNNKTKNELHNFIIETLNSRLESSSVLEIKNILFGPSAFYGFSLFKSLDIKIYAHNFFNMLTSVYKSMPDNVIKIDSIDKFNLIADKNMKFNIKTDLTLSSGLPFNFQLASMDIATGESIDKTIFCRTDIDSFALTSSEGKTKMSMSLGVEFSDDHNAAILLGVALNDVLNGMNTGGHTIGLKSVVMKSSHKKSITMFDDISISYPITKTFNFLFKHYINIPSFFGLMNDFISENIDSKSIIDLRIDEKIKIVANILTKESKKFIFDIGGASVSLGLNGRHLLDTAMTQNRQKSSIMLMDTVFHNDEIVNRNFGRIIGDTFSKSNYSDTDSISIYNIAIGTKENSLTIFKLIELDINLNKFINFLGIYLPINIPDVLKSITIPKISPDVDNISVMLDTDNKFNYMFSAAVNMPFIFKLSLGNLKTDIFLNDKKLMSASVDGNGIFKPLPINGRNLVSVDGSAEFSKGQEIKSEFSPFVNNILNGDHTAATIGIRNIDLDVNNKNPLPFLRHVKLRLDVDSTLDSIGIKLPLIDYFFNYNLDFDNESKSLPMKGVVDIKMQENETIKIDGSVGFIIDSFISATIYIPYAKADLYANGEKFVSATLPIKAYSNSYDGNTFIDIPISDLVAHAHQNAAAETSLGDIVKGIVKLDVPYETNGTIGIGGIQVGNDENNIIDLFSDLSIEIPVAKVVKKERLDIDHMLENIVFGTSLGNAKVNSVDIRLTDENEFVLKTDTNLHDFVMPLKISIDAPYVNLGSIDVDETHLLSTNIQGLSVTNEGHVYFDTKTSFGNNHDIHKKLAELINIFDTGLPLENSLGVSGLEFGFSESDKISMFKNIRLPAKIKPFIDNVGKNFESLLKTDMKFDVRLDNKSIYVDALNLPIIGNATITVSEVVVDALDGPGFEILIGSSFDLDFDVAIELPYATVGLDIGKNQFLDLNLHKISIGKENDNVSDFKKDIHIKLDLLLGSGEELQNSMAEIIESVLKWVNKDTPGTIDIPASIGYLDFGQSSTNSVGFMRDLKFNVPLNGVISKFLHLLSNVSLPSKSDIVDWVGVIGLHLNNLIARTAPGAKLESSLQLEFMTLLPITLKNINSVHYEFGIDSNYFVELDIEAFNIEGTLESNSTADISCTLSFIASNEIKESINNFVQDLYDGSLFESDRQVSLRNFSVGRNYANAIKVFEKAEFSLPLKVLLSRILHKDKQSSAKFVQLLCQMLGLKDYSKFTDILDYLQLVDVRKFRVDLAETSRIKTIIDAGIKEVTSDIKIDIGYVDVRSVIDSQEFARVLLKDGTKIVKDAGNSGDESLHFDTDVKIILDDSLTTRLSFHYLIEKLLSNHELPDTSMGIRGIVFGHSSDDSIRTFDDIKATVGVRTALKKTMEIVKPVLEKLNLDDIRNNPPFSIDTKSVVLDALSSRELLVGVHFTLKDAEHLYFNLPYASGTVDVEGIPFSTGKLTNILLDNNKLDMDIVVEFGEPEMRLIEPLGYLVSNILFHTKFDPKNLLYNGRLRDIKFGPKENPSSIFSKIVANTDKVDTGLFAVKNFVDSHVMWLDEVRTNVSETGLSSIVRSNWNVTVPLDCQFNSLAGEVRTKGGKNNEYDIYVANADIFLNFEDTYFVAGVEVHFDTSPQIFEFIPRLVDNLLSWKCWSCDAFMGYAILRGSNGEVFDYFKDLAIPGPYLKMYDGFKIAISPRSKHSEITKDLLLFPFDTQVQFPNRWGLHLNMGYIELGIATKKGPLLGIKSYDPVYFINADEGGREQASRNFTMAVGLDREFTKLFKTNKFAFFSRLRDAFVNLLTFKKFNLSMDIINKETGKPFYWYHEWMKVMSMDNFKDRMPSILFGLFRNTRIRFSGRTYENISDFTQDQFNVNIANRLDMVRNINRLFD